MRILPPIVLTDIDTAGTLLTDPSYTSVIQHVVSFGAENDRLPKGFNEHPARKLRLVFDDIERAHTLSGYYGPSSVDAAALLHFYEGVKEGTLLVHCAQGIARSSAATLAYLAGLTGPGNEVDAVRWLMDVREENQAAGLRDGSAIRPNRRLVWLVDQALGRGGALLHACQYGPLAPVYAYDSWSPA